MKKPGQLKLPYCGLVICMNCEFMKPFGVMAPQKKVQWCPKCRRWEMRPGRKFRRA